MTSQQDRKPWYGTGEQPWDVIVRLGWGPAFAAANVLKYLRRDKALEHSLESARWYYARLLEGAAGEINGPWTEAFSTLEDALTREELILARNIKEEHR